ncbi:hypothetical protein AB0I39_34030 [Kitasatospora purpeofusca]|uniref:hypothetical protein n=1 Tax=Kitasatospora purpeofusca TaxID=67352 RepID=UPI0033EE389B
MRTDTSEAMIRWSMTMVMPGGAGRTHRRRMSAGLVCTGLLALGGGVLARRRAARKAARG